MLLRAISLASSAQPHLENKAMEITPGRARNKGAAVTALIRDEQQRYRQHDASLEAMLHEHYDYIAQHIDPIMSKAIEQALLYQPDQIADFMAHFFRGNLDPKNYHYVEIHRQTYFDRKLRHLLTLAMMSAVKERPASVESFFAEFFEARTKFF